LSHRRSLSSFRIRSSPFSISGSPFFDIKLPSFSRQRADHFRRNVSRHYNESLDCPSLGTQPVGDVEIAR